MRNIRLTIAYEGTNYSGWQIQPNAITIQEVVQKAVRGMTGEKNNLLGASRTDAGVHALAQVAAFRTEKNISPDGFRRGLNSNLPRDIRIIRAEDVAEGFHPVRDARSKCYAYIISVGEHEHPLSLKRSWCVSSELDIRGMEEAARYIVGRHDFSAFRGSGGSDESPVREIYSVSIARAPLFEIIDGWRGAPFGGGWRGVGLRGRRKTPAGELRSDRTRRQETNTTGPVDYKIDISGNGFLKHMVRNIVGTLVDVGLGKTTPEAFKKILDSKDRKKAGRIAPASGLYLVSVVY